MPYMLIPLVASILLGFFHVLFTDAPVASKIAVGMSIGASVVVWWSHPRWAILATVTQVVVSLYVILRGRLHGYDV